MNCVHSPYETIGAIVELNFQVGEVEVAADGAVDGVGDPGFHFLSAFVKDSWDSFNIASVSQTS